MEDIDPTFVKRVQPGDIIAAGSNFGCGSSREHAPIAIKASGVAVVVAKSFARIFYRNSINIGLPIVECGAQIGEGDELEIDFDAGVLRNINKGTQDAFTAFPPFFRNVSSTSLSPNVISFLGEATMTSSASSGILSVVRRFNFFTR